MKSAVVIAHGSLADFIGPIGSTRLSAVFTFTARSLAKDAIESVGIPHPEVDLILANNEPIRFNSGITDGMKIEAYPYGHPVALEHESPIRIPELEEPKFLVDENLGRLATGLSILGFDTMYASGLDDAAIAARAHGETRILLSRDIGILKRSIVTRGLWLRSDDPDTQVVQVIRRYNLWPRIRPFTRCLDCNVELERLSREEALVRVPRETIEAFEEFYRCAGCDRTFWKGSHYDRMTEWIEKIRALIAPQANR